LLYLIQTILMVTVQLNELKIKLNQKMINEFWKIHFALFSLSLNLQLIVSSCAFMKSNIKCQRKPNNHHLRVLPHEFVQWGSCNWISSLVLF
jgi:hypothetical protein